MNRIAQTAAAAVVIAVIGTAGIAAGAPALAAPAPQPVAELTWTLTCDGSTVAITSGAAPAVPGHDPLYTPVFSDEHGTFVMISEGVATATFTDAEGVVVATFQREGTASAQGGDAARKGGVNARSCVAVADSTPVWADDGSHLRIELPMQIVVVGRR